MTDQDAVDELRAIVESHERYTDMLGRPMEALAIHPTLAKHLLSICRKKTQPNVDSPEIRR